ncbi:MBL fold metallo-hydrolase [Bdellovibrionota bacterium FG-1]
MAPDSLQDHMRNLLLEFTERGYSQTADVDKFIQEVPRHRFGGYGGNTACVEVSHGTEQVILDAGSGIRPLGYQLMEGACGRGTGVVHILFTHFHWDHLVGLPFFTPIFIPGNKIHVYAVQPELSDVLKTVFKKPYFPISLEKLGASIEYHRLEPRQPVRFGDMIVTPYELDHPDPCWGYKFESGGKVFSHCVDTECLRVTAQELGPDLPLYQGVDLMIFDAQYTLMETIEKVNWGHAAASLGLDIAMREGIKKVIFMHHDPASSMEKIAAAESQARRYYESQLKSAHRSGIDIKLVDWAFAYEGMVFDL